MITFFQSVKSFVTFLWDWKKTGGQLVDQNTANMRAAICSACHNNLQTNEVRKKTCCGGGAAQSVAVSVARATIIQGKKTTYDKSLLACVQCGCDLKIKVWIPINALGYKIAEINAWPSFCWVKKVADGKEV